MNDIVTKGTGNSRYLKSNISSSTTWEQFRDMLRNGTFPFDFNGINPSGVTDVGTSLSKKTLFDAENDALYELTGENAVPNEAFHILGKERQKSVFYDYVKNETPIFTNFTDYAYNYDRSFRKCASDGKGRIVACLGPVSSHGLFYSDDKGRTFKPAESPWDSIQAAYSEIGYVCGHFISVKRETEVNPTILISKNGEVWEEKTLNWNLSDQYRLYTNKRIVGNDDFGLILPYNYHNVSTAVYITKSGDDLVFTKKTFNGNSSANCNDGYYVEYYMNGPSSSRISYSTSNPYEDVITVTTDESVIGSEEKIKNCVYCNGYIVMIYTGYFESEKTVISMYNLKTQTWERIYSSTDSYATQSVTVCGAQVMFGSTSTHSYIVDTSMRRVSTVLQTVGSSTNITSWFDGEEYIAVFGSKIQNHIAISESGGNALFRFTNLLGEHLGDGLKIETGSYTGTGTYGKGNPNELAFEFEPKLVIIQQSVQSNMYSSYGIGIAESGSLFRFAGNEENSSTNYGVVNSKLNGKQFSYYTTSNDASYQFNSNNNRYFYVAIG